MSRKKKALIWLVVIAGILYLSFGNPSKETITLVIVLAGFYVLLWVINHEIKSFTDELDRRLRKVENHLGLLSEYDADEKERLSRPVSYRISLGLLPNWAEIIKKLAEQNKQKPDEFLKEIFEDKELGIKEGEGLFGKYFWFVISKDELTGMDWIWSCHHKNFVDRPEIEGWIFESWPFSLVTRPTVQKYGDNLVTRSLQLSPRGARFVGEEKIAEIPYYDILRLLLDLEKYTDGGTMHSIKEFPEELRKEFEENSIRYDNDPWSFLYYREDEGDDFDKSENQLNNDKWLKNKGVKLYNRYVDCHVFHAPYYSVSIELNIFTPSTEL